MSLTLEESREETEAKRPTFGWVSLGGGLYTVPHNFDQDKLFLTPWFKEFAERTRASYSFFEYLRTIWRQRRQGSRR